MLIDAKAKVVVGYVIRRERERVLHRRFDLNAASIGSFSVMVLRHALVDRELVLRLSKDLSEVADETTVKREPLDRIREVQPSNDRE